MKQPTRRTIMVSLYEPGLLGWCRWEIATELHYGHDPGRTVHHSTLATGRWKWRGRHAKFCEATVEADIYFKGPPCTLRVAA